MNKKFSFITILLVSFSALFGCASKMSREINESLQADEALVLVCFNFKTIEIDKGYASIDLYHQYKKSNSTWSHDAFIKREETGRPILFKTKAGYVGAGPLHRGVYESLLLGITSEYIEPGTITYIGDIDIKTNGYSSFTYGFRNNVNTVNEAKIMYRDYFDKYKFKESILEKYH